MTKNEKELLTDAVRLCCPLIMPDGIVKLCAIGRIECTRHCSKVSEFWRTYRQLKDKEILI